MASKEQDRLAALNAYRILDTEPEESFDDLTGLAARLCNAPISLISLVDEDRQWFKSERGLGVRETCRADSVCHHAIQQDLPVYVVPDLAADERFSSGPLVDPPFSLRFYAGAVLRDPDGHALGTLCVLDHQPRQGLTDDQAEALVALGRQVMSLLALRRALAKRRDSEAQFRALADAMPQMVWSTLPDGYHDYYNARWYEFTGVPAGSTDGEAWNGMFHPEDQERAWARWRRSLATGEPYEIEYRLRHHSGEYRWTLGRALPIRGEDGEISRWFGTCTDIHDQRSLAESQSLLSRELSHRIKNIFSVVSGLVALSARRYPEAGEFAKDLRQRIMALARAHDFVRPSAAAGHPERTSLGAMIGQLMEPYGLDEGRIVIEGQDVAIDDQAATPLALTFHELATNAAKYGALASPDGRVIIALERVAGALQVVWSESGGPRVKPPSEGREGFGTTLSRLSVESQLGGTIARDWRPGGLVVTLELPLKSLWRPS